MDDATVSAVNGTGKPDGAGKARWSELEPHNWIKIAIIAGLFLYLFRAEWPYLIDRWLNDRSWSHGFLIPLFSLYLLDQRKRTLLNLEARPNYLGLPLLIAVVAFYFLNGVSASRYGYLQQLAIIPALAAIVLLLGGWRYFKYTWLPIAYLVFAMPVPRRYYVMATMPLRKLAATVAGALLNLVSGVEASVRGVVIEVVYNGQPMDPPLNVAEACSGMRLLMAFVALGVAMAYLHERPLWQRLMLLAATVPIAVLCNIIRVTTTGFIHVLIHPRYTQGIYHDALGVAMLPLAFLLYGGLAWFMESLFVEEEDNVKEIIVRRRDS